MLAEISSAFYIVFCQGLAYNFHENGVDLGISAMQRRRRKI